MKQSVSAKFLLCLFALVVIGSTVGFSAIQIIRSNNHPSSATSGGVSVAIDVDAFDLCPNLPNIQTSVPDDHYLDPETNDCLPVVTEPGEPEIPPTEDEDVCLNIPGLQISTPSGMINNNGFCFTPPNPPTSEAPPLKNVPEFLQPLVQFFVNLIPETVRDFFRNIPEEVVYQIPLYIFVLVFIFILIPILQSIREYLYKRRLIAFYNREKSIAEEKDNFITIASHYLRTPITIMRDTIPLLLGSGEVSPLSANAMGNTLIALGQQISTGLEAINNNPALQHAADTTAIKPKPFWRSGFFWLPIALSLIFTLLANFFLGVIGDKEIGTDNALTQVFIIIAFIVVLYLIVRNYQIQKKLRQEKDAVIAREQAIDTVRNNFLDQQAANIDTALNALFFTSPSSPPSKSYTLYTDGISRLSNIHNKFILLSQIKTGVNRNVTTFDLKSAIDRAITAQQGNITTKRLNVRTFVPSTPIVQNEPLFSFVISSTLDNAIKFANTNGHILIYSQPSDKMIHIKVSDNGRGIDPSRLDQLFKPFSRAEAAVDFSYEGLGLSLFLDRLILTYTGGSIDIAPRPTGGTDVTISSPLNSVKENLLRTTTPQPTNTKDQKRQ